MPRKPQPEFQPLANSRAIVRVPQARLTVLTSRLIRLEYSPTNIFEDRPSQIFWYRRQPVPKFQVKRTGPRLSLTTEHLELDYIVSERGFRPETLSIRIKDTQAAWKYGEWVSADNLGGTTRTLDGTGGPVSLEPGLISRSGWAVVDDSRSLLFDPQGWLRPRTDPESACDIYFFGYGNAYLDCLRDYFKVAGRIPLLPRFALGNWWSRYWAYSQDELISLMEEFKEQDVPISVCVIDMDWHLVATGNASRGWTGYSWNRKLFPQPGSLLKWLHRQALKVTLNLHPADGVYPHEDSYRRIASAMGLDPKSKTPVEFDPTDPKFVRAYFSILHHPLERQGVDFWWIDWQQGNRSKVEGIDPLWWLNHLHFLDIGRDENKRPLILSRWGGLGGHRYPIGFSGDTVVGWDTLAFQPDFTSTASNVGYSWWSHDIGGHMHGLEDPELFTRWVQFGVFSPIFRLHSTSNPFHERRPWKYSREIFHILRDAMRMRHSLIPYIYTMARQQAISGEPLVQPMYYQNPEAESAYLSPNQYYFGRDLIAAPFISPMDADTCLSNQSVWLPPGSWFNFFSGERLRGDRWHMIYGKLSDIPVLARAGAIIPMAPETDWNSTTNPKDLTIHVFPGADNRFVLYEDDGETTRFERGEFCQTPISQRWEPRRLRFELGPVEGALHVIPSRRRFQLIFHSIRRPDRVEVRINSARRNLPFLYDEQAETVLFDEVVMHPGDKLVVSLSSRQPLLSIRDRRIEKCREMLRIFKMKTDLKYRIDRDLPRILRNKNRLRLYAPELGAAQLAALMSCVDSS